ncbi:hypothetical protein ACQP3L_35975 [Escherichia coli]
METYCHDEADRANKIPTQNTQNKNEVGKRDPGKLILNSTLGTSQREGNIQIQ